MEDNALHLEFWTRQLMQFVERFCWFHITERPNFATLQEQLEALQANPTQMQQDSIEEKWAVHQRKSVCGFKERQQSVGKIGFQRLHVAKDSGTVNWIVVCNHTFMLNSLSAVETHQYTSLAAGGKGLAKLAQTLQVSFTSIHIFRLSYSLLFSFLFTFFLTPW